MKKPELVDDGARVIVRHKDPDHGPWTIAPVEPKGFRDAWRVLRGRYEPRVTLTRRLTVTGVNNALKRVYSSKMVERLNEPNLIFPIHVRKRSEP